MLPLSRREFIKQFGLLASLGLLAPRAVAHGFADHPFDMLVLGDSLIWGQGLKEQDKFYYLTKEWLQNDFFKNERKVNVKLKAHSGSTIFLHDAEAEVLKKTDISSSRTYNGEVPISIPTLEEQARMAKAEYLSEGAALESIELVMLTGGIVDITVPQVLNPFGDNKKLKSDIVQYCNNDMFRFLSEATVTFPNATFLVIGYFPMMTMKSDTGKTLNATLEAYGISGAMKPLANNILTKQFFKILQKKASKRSRIWFEDSNREFQTAVNRINEKSGKQRAVFVKSPLGEENAYETKTTLLTKMAKKGRAADELYDLRLTECRNTLNELKRKGWKQSVRQCELAGIGHPDPQGSRAYAKSIQDTLRTILH